MLGVNPVTHHSNRAHVLKTGALRLETKGLVAMCSAQTFRYAPMSAQFTAAGMEAVLEVASAVRTTAQPLDLETK